MRKRLLGLAFAASDLLVELTPDRRVAFALGAGPSAEVGAGGMSNQLFEDLVSQADRGRLGKALSELQPGGRMAPLRISMLAGSERARPALFSAFQLPELAPSVSCAISWAGPLEAVAPPPPILDAAGFLERAQVAIAEGGGAKGMTLDFIQVGGLAEDSDAARRVGARVEATLQSASCDGASAARLTPERFALLRDANDTRDLGAEVVELGRAEGLTLTVSADRVDPGVVPPLNALRALRFTIEHCLKDGGLSAGGQAFDAAMARTVREGEAFRTMVQNRAFEAHYQPIVDFKTGVVHHFEALARFSAGGGPADAIRMAEDLGLIESFDLAMLEKVLKRIRTPGFGLIKVAVNVSGASLASDAWVQSVLRMTEGTPDDRRRLIVEVTESAALADLEAAARRLASLKAAGIKICIDDFGSGAASFDYVHRLPVDTVKIDGKFVKGLEQDKRAQTMIAHLVELCRSLNLSTIAEFVETRPEADLLRDMGVNYGQGWLFGKAEAEPRTTLPASGPVAARRRGSVEAWG